MKSSGNILVVDDVPENLEVVTDSLIAAGYNVAAVNSGDRALKRLQTRFPDLILLDILMPDVDGFEVCRRLKADPQTADIPIIFITASPDLEKIAEGLALGAVDYIHKPVREAELLLRVKNHIDLYTLRRALEQKVEERTQQLQEAQLRMLQSEKMATHDPLTELPNRRLLMESLDHAIALTQRHNQTLALIFLDLDGFKQVNDTYGHLAGDTLLVQMTHRLKSCLRKSDGFFRLGGDEFVILVEQIESEAGSLELANKLLAELQKPFHINRHSIQIGGSFGVRIGHSRESLTVQSLITDADRAMYQAKRSRNCVVMHGQIDSLLPPPTSED